MYKKTNILLLTIISISAFQTWADDDLVTGADAGKTSSYFQYSHTFNTRLDRRHSDSFQLNTQTENNWKFTLKFSDYSGSGKNQDVSYDDMVGGSAGLVIQKGLSLPYRMMLSPSMEMDYGNNSQQYLLGGTLSFANITDVAPWNTRQ